ncbi:MAG: hypothetical protein K2N64_05260 [Anaeroplasmataceae bacterium]|nr:hypothetical protein [Anaeroplasmataceae bacterium]
MKKIIIGLKAFVLISILGMALGCMVSETHKKYEKKPDIKETTELPDNLSGVVFYGSLPYTFGK